MQWLWQKAQNPNLWVHLLFAVLAALALVFYEERLIADAGYYLFRVVNTQSFWVEHNRYILILSQVLPWLAVQIGLSLKAILILHSLGHVLFFYLLFGLARYVFQFKPAGPLLLLLQTLGIQQGFFVPMFELYYAAGLLVLLVAVWEHRQKQIHYWALPLLAFLILTSHFYAYLMLAVVMAWHFLEHGWAHRKSYALLLLVMVAVSLFKRFNVSPYEQGKINAFLSTLLEAKYNWAYLKNLLLFLGTHYQALLILVVANFFLLGRARAFQKWALVLIAFIGTLVMVNVSNYGFEPSRYQEQVYFTLSFMVAFPFTMLVFQKSSRKKSSLGLAAVVIIACLQLGGIVQSSTQFTARIKEMKNLLEQGRALPGSKFVVSATQLTYDPNWSYPIESLLFSSVPGPQKSLTICTTTDYQFGENPKLLKNPQRYLFRRWEVYPLQRLNTNYFQLEVENYQTLEPLKPNKPM